MRYLSLFLILAIFYGCKYKPEPVELGKLYAYTEVYPTSYFSGDMNFDTNNAQIRICATGQVLHISKDGAFYMLQQSYEAIREYADSLISVEFMGHILVDTLIASQYKVVVDSLIGFRLKRSCAEEMLLTGNYSYVEKGKKIQTLNLFPDYTYKEKIQFMANDSVVERTGRWHMEGRMQLSIVPRDTIDKIASRFEIIPANFTLAKNSGGDIANYFKTKK